VIELRGLCIDDVEMVHAVIRSAEIADRIPIVTPRQEVDDMFADPYFEPDTDGVVVEVDGSIVGWGRIHHRPSTADFDKAYIQGDIHPHYRRRGLGTALLRWQLERAAQCMTTVPSRYIRADVYDWRSDACALFEAGGMKPVRYTDELRMPLAIPQLPSPLAVEVMRWTSDHTEGARRVINEAFTDHWGSTPRDEEAFRSLLSTYGTRLDLSHVAVAGGRIVGAVLNFHVPEDEEVTGRLDGWIGTLGVARPFRRRGVATALIVASLGSFRAAGLTHAMIGVDSENPSGAHHLYRRLGFEPVNRSVTYELVV